MYVCMYVCMHANMHVCIYTFSIGMHSFMYVNEQADTQMDGWMDERMDITWHNCLFVRTSFTGGVSICSVPWAQSTGGSTRNNEDFPAELPCCAWLPKRSIDWHRQTMVEGTGLQGGVPVSWFCISILVLNNKPECLRSSLWLYQHVWFHLRSLWWSYRLYRLL